MVEPPLGPLLGRFNRLQRLTCTDAHGANLRAERARRLENPALNLLHTTCDIHKIATIVKRCAIVAPIQVTGMIGIALALHQGGAMKSFRRTLREFLREKVTLLHASPGDRQTNTDAQFWHNSCRRCPASLAWTTMST